MTKSILRYFVVVLIITLLSTSLLSATLISNGLLATTKENMVSSLKLIDYAIDFHKPFSQQVKELNPLTYSQETRLSIIDKNGNVIADTDSQDISKNHIDRQEIQEALKTGIGYAQRKSETTGRNMLYTAYYHHDYIIRLSIPYNGIVEYIPALIPALSISAVVSFIIALLLSRRLAYRISKPILEIGEGLDHMTKDFRFDLKTYDYQEFNVIVDTIHNLSHRLRKSMREVRLEKLKIDEILRQMSEGFVLLDENYKILSINAQATSLLGNLKIYDSFIECSKNEKIIEALKNGAYKQMIELNIDDNIYACFISRVDLGTTLLFVDITASKKAEKMRNEFFSNVSHELKTPLTSIKGYSDLLVQDYIQDEEKKKQMLYKIQNGVNNISTLINDILMLSKIENMDNKVEMTTLKIKNMISDVLESYVGEMKQHDIHIHYDFKDILYMGDYQQIYMLFNNLIGNAIKYNKDQGHVYIDVEEVENAMKITIKDTGIGIPLADQSRIFERFYRVDKGRSRERGGTGLGLAIVKHIVSYYKGTIYLESELNIGTTIEVVLPQQSEV